MRCPACTGVFLWPQMDAETERRFYADNAQLKRTLGDEFDWNDYARRTEADTARRAQFLAPFLGPTVRLIEVGCGYGFVLSRIRDRVRQAIGIEPGETRRAHGKEKLGLDLRPPPLVADDVTPGSIDVACAFQVLEHIRQPAPFLAEIFTVLKPGGRLVIEVPNFADLYVGLSRPYRAFHFQSAHALYYTPATLKRVLAQAGFTVDSIEGVQRYAMANAAHWLRHGKPQIKAPARRMSNGALALLDRAYRHGLARSLRSDTIIATARKPVETPPMPDAGSQAQGS
jgi:SAM-dependent methyltransferase